MFGIWKKPLIWGRVMVSPSVEWFSLPPALTNPQCEQFLAWMISSRLMGFGEKLSMSLWSPLVPSSSPRWKQGNKLCWGLVPMTSGPVMEAPPDCIVWALLPLQPLTRQSRGKHCWVSCRIWPFQLIPQSNLSKALVIQIGSGILSLKGR